MSAAVLGRDRTESRRGGLLALRGTQQAPCARYRARKVRLSSISRQHRGPRVALSQLRIAASELRLRVILRAYVDRASPRSASGSSSPVLSSGTRNGPVLGVLLFH